MIIRIQALEKKEKKDDYLYFKYKGVKRYKKLTNIQVLLSLESKAETTNRLYFV